MVDDVLERFEALAARWDLQGLHRDVTEVLAGLEDSERPFVPSRLALALEMFLDAYGPSMDKHSSAMRSVGVSACAMVVPSLSST